MSEYKIIDFKDSDFIELVKKFESGEANLSELSKIYGYNESFIKNLIVVYNKYFKQKNRKTYNNDLVIEDLVYLYFEKEMNFSEIARIYGANPEKVSSIIKKYAKLNGLDLRKRFSYKDLPALDIIQEYESTFDIPYLAFQYDCSIYSIRHLLKNHYDSLGVRIPLKPMEKPSSVEDLVELYEEYSMTFKQIANYYTTSEVVIRNKLKKYYLEKGTVIEDNNSDNYIKSIVSLFFKKGVSISRLSEIFNISNEKISKIIIESKNIYYSSLESEYIVNDRIVQIINCLNLGYTFKEVEDMLKDYVSTEEYCLGVKIYRESLINHYLVIKNERGIVLKLK